MTYPVTLREHQTPKASMTAPGAFVLRDFGPDHHNADRYVTHWRNDETPGASYYIEGGYYSDLARAEKDFARRVARHR